MSITYILIALLAVGNTFYAYRCIIDTRGFIDQYGTGDGSAFPIKMVGSFCAGMAFMLVYVLLTDLGGKWELFTFGFVQAALLTVLGYQTVNGPWAEVEGINATKGELYRTCSLCDFKWWGFVYGGNCPLHLTQQRRPPVSSSADVR